MIFLVAKAADCNNFGPWTIVKIPGFRPGKEVPESVLVNFIGPEQVKASAVEAVLKRTLPEAMSSVRFSFTLSTTLHNFQVCGGDGLTAQDNTLLLASYHLYCKPAASIVADLCPERDHSAVVFFSSTD